MNKPSFSKDLLLINNIEKVVDNLVEKLRIDTFRTYKRRGALIGISGGIDSSVTLALAVKAYGPEKVFGVMMLEQVEFETKLTLNAAGKKSNF